MYNVNYFKTANEKEVTAFMHAHPFITLCGVNASGKAVATHIPVLLQERDGKLYLQAHIMRKQDHTLAFEQNAEVLAIFTGAHTYVSASWYSNPASASTWNYQAVHARGTLRFLDDAGLLALLTKLTENFENNPHSPSLVQHMPEGYVTSMMKAIVAFEVEVTSIEHVFKLSQNRDEKSYENIMHHLAGGDNEAKAVAEIMNERKKDVFK